MTPSSRLRSTALLMSAVFALTACGGPTTLTISDEWSRAVPRVAEASAIYFEITNGLDSAVTVIGGSSEACASIELHETSIDDNRVMAMRPLADGLLVGPGESAEFEPLGTHLMCIEPTVFEGSFAVTVDFDGAADIEIVVPIEDR
ncbi:MAG: copper chaperone PCu(A)C [bacterium]|nr:copper chaperone PCu(A)C [bacterium]